MKTMTSKQRLDSFMRNEAVDHLPNLSIIGSLTSHYTDTPSIFTCQDYDILLKGSVDAARDLGIDYFQNYVQLGSNLFHEANDFSPATSGRKYLIEDCDDVYNIKSPDLDNSPLMKKYLSQVKKSVEYADDIHPFTVVVGPITAASSFCGVQDFLIYTIDDEEAVIHMLNLVLENAIASIKLLAKQGIEYVLIADPSLSLVTPTFLKEHTVKLYKKLFDEIRNLGIYSRMHVCGNTTAQLPTLVDFGMDILDIDHPVDYAKALEVAKGKTVICGNLDPSGDILSSSKEEVYNNVTNLCEICKGYKALVMPGCEIPSATNLENVKQIKRALQDHHKKAQ